MTVKKNLAMTRIELALEHEDVSSYCDQVARKVGGDPNASEDSAEYNLYWAAYTNAVQTLLAGVCTKMYLLK